MSCGCKNKNVAPDALIQMDAEADRYVSFVGIDCEGNAQRLMDHLLELTAKPGVGNKFWDNFRNQYESFLNGQGLKHDPLYLLHANVFYIRDLFEEQEDSKGLLALEQLEEECF